MCPNSLSDDEKISSVKAHPSAENLLSLRSFILQRMLNCLPVFPGCLHAMSKYCKQRCSYSISGSTQPTKRLKCGAKSCSLGMRVAALSQACSNHMFTSLLLTVVGIMKNPEEKPIKNKCCCIGYNICFSQKKEELSFLLYVSHRKPDRSGV